MSSIHFSRFFSRQHQHKLFWLESRRFRIVAFGSIGFVTLGTAFYYGSEVQFAGRTVARIARTSKVIGSIIVDYKRNFISETVLKDASTKSKTNLVSSEHERIENNNAIHLRAAQRLLKLFQKNGGIFIKLGQHLAALEYILPEEYCSTMSILQNQAPTSSLQDVQRVFAEDLGVGTLEEIFAHFDPVPIGAASLAQVHRAILKDSGCEVAVKIQHHRLHDFVEMDMFTVGVAVRLIKRLFPEFQLDWLVDEMKLNLPMELDFVHEGHNAERVARNLRESFGSKVRVPRIFWTWTTPRILVMEYLPGAKVTNVQFLRENGIDPHKVSERLTKVFSEMIFINGFVHCDPHPGNIFIRPLKSANSSKWKLCCPWNKPSWEMVLLDHGLYREIADTFRLDYACLWKALIDGDEESIRIYSEKLGGGHAHRLFSCVLTQRTWSSISKQIIGRPNAVLEIALIKEKAGDYLSQVADLLARLPRPLLLLLKTNDLLRAVDRALEANTRRPSQTFLIMGDYCIRAIFEEEKLEAGSSIISHLKAHARLHISRFKLTLASFFVSVWSMGMKYIHSSALIS